MKNENELDKVICMKCGDFYNQEEVIDCICVWCRLEEKFPEEEEDSDE
jgi:hypothetical protein